MTKLHESLGHGAGLWSACLSVVLIGLTGCRPAGPLGPKLDADASGTAALAAYDKNADGGIDSSEADASPGLKEAFARYDKDQDGKVTATEVAERILFYRNCGVAVISGSTRVTFRQRPLPGATVVFEPESFLGESYKPCQGVTGPDGTVSVSREAAEFPGLYLGLYRVRISTAAAGKEIVPAKYNTETTLGYEATTDRPNVSNVITFDLTK